MSGLCAHQHAREFAHASCAHARRVLCPSIIERSEVQAGEAVGSRKYVPPRYGESLVLPGERQRRACCVEATRTARRAPLTSPVPAAVLVRRTMLENAEPATPRCFYFMAGELRHELLLPRPRRDDAAVRNVRHACAPSAPPQCAPRRPAQCGGGSGRHYIALAAPASSTLTHSPRLIPSPLH